MRQITFACIVASLATSCWAQEAPARLSYETSAKPLFRIVDELKAKGIPIGTVDPAIAGDILFVRTAEVPTETLLAEIAKVTYSKWTKRDDGTLRLMSNGDELRALARKKESARIAEISKGLAELRKELYEMDNPKAKPADESAGPKAVRGAFRMQGADGPEAKLLLRMITMATPAQLAKLEKGDRIVYSTTPTRMQLPLTISSQAINEFVAGYNAAAAEDAKRKPEDQDGTENEAQMKAMREMMTLFMPNTSREPLESMPAKVLLVVSSGGGMGGFGAMFGGGGTDVTANLYVFNAKGKVIGQADRSLGDSGMFGGMIAAAARMSAGEDDKAEQEAEKNLIPSKDAPLELSKLTQEIEKLMRFDNPMEAFRANVSEETMKVFSRPDLFDPLSFKQSDSLTCVAKANGWNVIANLSDKTDDLISQIQASGKPSSTKLFFNQLQKNDALTVEVKDGWMRTWPKDPEDLRANRLDRASLTKLIAACRAKTVPSLDDLADFAARNNPPTIGEPSSVYFMFFATNAMQFFMDGFQSWDMLKLFGLLTPTQRDAVKRGEAIPFAQIIGAGNRQLTKMVYGAPPRLKVASDEKKMEGLGIMGEFMGMMPMPMRDFRTEPTEIAPNGLPSNGYLECKVLAETFVQVMGEGEASKRALMSTGPREVAMFRFFAEADNGGFGGMMPKFESFRPGERLTLNMRIRVSPDAYVAGTLTDDKIDGNAKAVPFAQLPIAFQKTVNDRMEQFKKMPMGMGMPGGQRAAP